MSRTNTIGPRVGVITELYPTDENPAYGPFVRERVRALSEVVTVEVFLMGDARPCGPVPVHLLSPPRLGKAYRISLASLWMARQVRRHIKGSAEPVALLHAQGLAPAGYAAVRTGKKLGIPAVVTAMGSDVMKYPDHLDLRPVVRYAAAQASALVAVDPHLVKPLEELGAKPARIKVIPNGVDTDRFRLLDANQVAAFRERHGLVGAPVLLFAKPHTIKNGIETILGALPRWPACTTLAVLGEGPLTPKLQEAADGAEANVLLFGARPPEEMPDWYSAADILLLPSLWEGRPNVVLEALACGTPVLASAIGGVTSIVRDGENGVLVEPGDAEALLAGLDRALGARWDPTRVRETVSEWTWERFAADHLALYRRLLEGS